MKQQPHAIFTRNRYGVHTTLEVNPGTASSARIVDGVKIPIYDSIVISHNITPGWSYAAGLHESHWHHPYRYVLAGFDESYITKLRRCVAWLTGNTYIGGKPKLGFHSKHAARKREEAARLRQERMTA